MTKTQNGNHELIDAIRFQQGIGAGEGRIMYLCALPSKWLIANTKVDHRQAESELPNDDFSKGYQRKPVESHLRAIVRYLRGTFRNSMRTGTGALPVFPTSVLLAARITLDFSPSPEPDSVGPHWSIPGKLKIPKGLTLYTIDGQHRIEGIRKAMEEADLEWQALLGDYRLPVTIMECDNKIHEMYHFVTINKEAKNVRTDLAEELLDVIYAKNPHLIRDDFVSRATKDREIPLTIVRKLADQPGQPWFGRIARGNEPRKGIKVASQGQFSKSLRHICGNKPFDWDVDKLIGYIVNFWKVLAELLPKAFEDPRKYTIQRAVGFGALHQVLPKLVTCYDGTPASLRKVLEGVEPYFTDPDYWTKGKESSKYSSEGGYRTHAEAIAKAIDEQNQR